MSLPGITSIALSCSQEYLDDRLVGVGLKSPFPFVRTAANVSLQQHPTPASGWQRVRRRSASDSCCLAWSSPWCSRQTAQRGGRRLDPFDVTFMTMQMGAMGRSQTAYAQVGEDTPFQLDDSDPTVPPASSMDPTLFNTSEHGLSSSGSRPPAPDLTPPCGAPLPLCSVPWLRFSSVPPLPPFPNLLGGYDWIQPLVARSVEARR